MQMSPCHYLRWAEREVRRNLILGPCLPSPCQHRRALRWSAFHPSLSLAAKPYDLRCLRVFLRASASPRQAASLELHAIPTQTEQSAGGAGSSQKSLGPCLPSPCQHRNAPDLRYPPRAVLVSLPPQREPRCEAVRSPLSPRSQVLTFLRSLASAEANPEKMFSPCFSAPPRLRVKQHLSNSTRSRPRRNIVCQSPIGRSSVIGIGAAVTRRPLPHHRAYGSVHGGSRRLR